MTTRTNGQRQDDELIDNYSHCIIGCGWVDCSHHGDYCERSVGSRARGVTEPGWADTEVWCSVIHPYIRDTVPASYLRDSNRYRDGVQATIQARGEFVIDTESEEGWSKIRVNFTPAEARQLAAQLIAAADTDDGINQEGIVMHWLKKIADRVGADIFSP